MTYREALEANKRSYRYLMMKKGIFSDSSRRVQPDLQHGSGSENGKNGSKNLVKIFIPGGTVINLLNIIELSSPSGISLKASLPFLNGDVQNIVGSMVGKFISSAGQPDGFISITRVDDTAQGK